MKAARTALRTLLRTAIPDLGHMDRFNNQYSDTYLREEDAIDYDRGAIFIEVQTPTWETLGDGRTQEGDSTVRIHVCRTFLGDTHDDAEELAHHSRPDLVELVHRALQGRSLTDGQGRTIATALMRTGSDEDNEHGGLEVDVLSYSTRFTDYLPSDHDALSLTTTEAELEVTNAQTLNED
jgi:hypothetical protein